MHDLIENLLSQMTLQEKIAMLAGTNTWYTVPVARLGISSLKMSARARSVCSNSERDSDM